MKKNLVKHVHRLNRSGNYLLLLAIFCLISACNSDKIDPVTQATNRVTDTVSSSTAEEGLSAALVDTDRIYIPQEFASMDFLDETSQWYYGRSRQSDHFIVFWDTEYEDLDPNSESVPASFRVDIDDLLEKAEEFYTMNIDVLEFAKTGVGESNLDDYKMMIFIYYQTEWLATGAGYDDVIGALWVNPATCQPVGSTIGHEIGHSFQYQVYSDLGGGTGFRYGFGGNGGNGFWEQTAQWQSFQSYPQEPFTSYNFTVYTENYHRHVCHEWYRYASYFIHYYWTDKHGMDMVGRLWREAQNPEDPIQAYMRITGISNEQLNAEIYDAATKFVTWDLDAIRENGEGYIGKQTFGYTSLDDGSIMVSYDRCPGTTGYNVIRLNVPSAGTEVSAQFTGLVNESGFNQVSDPSRAGWRYGYVALLENGTRVYGDMNQGSINTASITVPENCEKLWFVVTGAPSTYASHAWDEDETNDDQWPYKLKFSNTNLYGKVSFDGTETPEDISLTYDVSFPASDSEYVGATVELGDDVVNLAYAFVLQPNEISNSMDDEVLFYAVEGDGSLNATTTANGYGHWFDADGDVINWGSEAILYSEFDASNFTFTLGQYPTHVASGDQYTIKQALVYEYESGATVQATFVFNITLE